MFETIGSAAWPLASVVIVFVFKKQFSSLLERRIQVKFGDKEVSLPTPELEVPTQKQLSEGVASKEEPSTQNQEELVAESTEKTSELSSQDGLFWKMLNSFSANDLEQAAVFFEELQKTESNSSNKSRNEMFYLHMRYKQGDFSSIEKLQNFTKISDVATDAYYWIGICYESTNDFEKALVVYEKGEQSAQTDQDRAKLVKKIANCLFSLEKKEQAFSRLMDEIGRINEPIELSELYESLAKLYEKEQDFELRAIALDKAVENHPNDTQLRFGAAYAYSQKELYALSAFHYKTLLSIKPNDSNSLNNLGVAYSRLGVLAQSIKSYKKAFELEETLAAANLAYQYMDKGFLDEASKVLDIARQKANVHPNVGSALAKLSEIKEEEAKKEEVFLKTALEQRQFLLKFAEAFFTRNNLFGFDGMWKLSNTTNVEITVSDSRIEANWSQGDEERFKFEGNMSNQAAMLTYHHYKKYSNDSNRAYAYLSKDGQQLFIMLPKSTKNSFMTLSRIESLQDEKDNNHEV